MSGPAARGGIKHLDYLVQYWMPLSLWQSWSEFGQITASAVLKIPIEGVIPTTNHLESFNGILKRKHLPAWLHSGRRLRFDSLIYLLVTHILPGIFSYCRAQQEYADWLVLRFCDHSNGRNLLAVHQNLAQERAIQQKAICWWEFDAVRDANAANILKHPENISFSCGDDSDTFLATCLSSLSTTLQPDYHKIIFRRSGASSCLCPDFQKHGGACKHLCAVRHIVDYWVHCGLEKPFNYFPSHAAAVAAAPAGIARSNNPDQSHRDIGPMLSIQSPPQPICLNASITWDPPTLQALGLDNTTLDDLNELEDDLDSESTDAAEGSDSDSSSSELEPPVGTDYLVPTKLNVRCQHIIFQSIKY